jgi:hypothetical protein
MKEFRDLFVGTTSLRIYEDGRIFRNKKNDWYEIENNPNHRKGYNVIMIDKKQYMRSRLVCYAFKNLDLSSKSVIHYLDDDKLNCNIENLSIETSQSLKSYYKK